MNILDRVKRIRELAKQASPLPWTRTTLNHLVDNPEDGATKKIFSANAHSDRRGVLPENDVNAEIVEHLSHLAHEDFMFVVPEMVNETGEVGALQQAVWEQGNQLFPDRKPQQAFVKLYSELGEVIDNPHDGSEWADVFIMLFDLSKMYDIDVGHVVREKMEINSRRKWKLNQSGIFQHVKGGTDD